MSPSTSTLSTFFFFNDTATTEIYTLSLHDALPIWRRSAEPVIPIKDAHDVGFEIRVISNRSEEHTSELQSLAYLVCRLLLEKKNASLSEFDVDLSYVDTLRDYAYLEQIGRAHV